MDNKEANILQYASFLNNYREVSKELPTLLKLITEDLETARKSSKANEIQLQTFLHNTEQSVSLECAELQKRNCTLEEQISALKNEIEHIHQVYKSETEKLNQIINSEKERSELIKAEFKRREKELENDNILMRASAKQAYENMESKLLSSLTDITEKLYESKNQCNTFQARIFALQKQLNCSIENSRKLEEKLNAAEAKLKKDSQNTQNNNNFVNREPTSFQNSTSANTLLQNATNRDDNTNLETNRYIPLETIGGGLPVMQTNNNFSDLNKAYTCRSNYKTSLYRPNTSYRNKHYLPELKPVSVSKEEPCKLQKKRKLYNPDDNEFRMETLEQ